MYEKKCKIKDGIDFWGNKNRFECGFKHIYFKFSQWVEIKFWSMLINYFYVFASPINQWTEHFEFEYLITPNINSKRK